MAFIMINESFLCENCGKMIDKHPLWSARKHCPFCLCSKHLDKEFPWDRASNCLWLMHPIWIDYKKNKWWMIKHRCVKCKKEIINKIAPDDEYVDFVRKLNKVS